MAKKLGEGSEGTVHLWNLLDTNQKIVERTVIKNLEVSNSHFIQADPAKGKLLQVHIQQKLVPDGSAEAYTVPTLAAGKLQKYKDAWRTFHPYYSMGDFADLVKVNTRSRHARSLSEPFIWFTLHRMMRAAVAMDERLEDKPGNGHAGSLGRDADYIIYPPSDLGDFGKSYLTSEDESWRRKIRGTVEDSIPKLHISEHATISLLLPQRMYGKSAIVFYALWKEKGSIYQTFHDYDLSCRNENWIKQTPAGAAAIYGTDLLDIVESCVRCEVEGRPSAQEALVLIEEYMPTYADWSSRSVQAEYYARGDYVNGRGSDFYIGMAVLNRKTGGGEAS